MPVELKEYIGNMPSSKAINKTSIDCKEYYEDFDPIADDSIMQDIEGLHVGPTRNYTWYTEQALQSSIPSWTKPYQKPLIMHHNEQDGKIIGRIVAVDYKTKNTRSNTPALVFTCNVPDKEGKEQIQDGRLKTVSVGVTAHDIRCSICGEPIELDEDGCPTCGHMRGQEYNGKTCYWMVYDMEAKELSYVIVPSDIYTHNLRTYKPTKKQMGLSENYKERETFKMEKNDNVNVKEKQDIDETVPKTQDADKTASEEDIKKETEKSVLEGKDQEIADLKQQIAELEADKTEAANKLDKVNSDLTVALEKVKSVQKQLSQETELKEAAESSLVDAKSELREAMEDNLNVLRSALNKPIMLKENLESRSVESIKDSIVDLKEELNGFNSVKNAPKVDDVTLKSKEEPKKSKVDVKEKKNDSNINVVESAKELLHDMLL